MSKRDCHRIRKFYLSPRLFGANGLFCQLNLGLLLDTLGPLRSCFDFHGVILSVSNAENS